MSAIRPEIERVLNQLKSWIRRYLLIDGLAWISLVACLLFGVSYLIDVIYYQATQLELPKTVRVLITLLMVVLLTLTIIQKLIVRLAKKIDRKSLSLLLERQFPVLNDRLITAVQLADSSGSADQRAMVDRATNEAVQKLTEVQLGKTLNNIPLRRSLGAAAVAVVLFGAFAALLPAGVDRWTNAFLKLDDNYWQPYRKNELTVQVLAGSFDKVRTFDEHGVYKHPRGEDLQLQAIVPQGVEPVSRVRLQYFQFGSTAVRRGQLSMSRMGDSDFRHTFPRVLNDQELWLRGGDYVNKQPFRIQVVDPPRVDSIFLKCDYPAYTGMDHLEEQALRVVGMQVAIPIETRFELQAATNKPLLQARIKTPAFELFFGFDEVTREPLPSTMTFFNSETSTSRTVSIQANPSELFDEKRQQIKLPLALTSKAAELLQSEEFTPAFPLPIAADDSIQIQLLDDDLIESPALANLTINGIPDQPPLVESRRTGIGTVVTRMASIPIEGRITDDYGVAKAWFSYRTQENLTEQRVPLSRNPSGEKEFRLEISPAQRVERFSLIPLELQEGQVLTLFVGAEDGDNLNGPHQSSGEVLTFQIVSQDDLLAKMFDREVALRSRFEQVRKEVADLQISLLGIQTQLDPNETQPDSETGDAPEKVAPAVISSYLERSLHQGRKNHTETRSIELSFRDLREELVNNRIDTAELLERIERRIIEPLSFLNQTDFNEVDRKIGLTKLAVERQTPTTEPMAETLEAVNHLLSQIDLILTEMRDRGTINELIQELQDLIDREKKLLEEIEEKRIEDSFFGSFS